MKRVTGFFSFFLLSVLTYGQVNLQSFDFLIGQWQGIEQGMAGEGIGFRTYAYDLGGNYIFSENISTFPKSEKLPEGEIHRDRGVMSFNSNLSKVIYREFHVEGFTNVFEYQEEESTDKKMVFITREIENNPGNWVAKLIWKKVSDNAFSEEFYIAMDGTQFVLFIKNEWKRLP